MPIISNSISHYNKFQRNTQLFFGKKIPGYRDADKDTPGILEYLCIARTPGGMVYYK